MQLSKSAKKIYFLGIKGVAMSGLAIIFKQMGYDVAGSDVSEKFITDPVLIKNKIKIFQNFSAKNISEFNPDLVVVGTSFSNNNPEYDFVEKQSFDKLRTKKLKTVLESELRGYVSQLKNTIAITGVHGKTTTTSCLAFMFKSLGLKPSYLFGSSKAYGLPANGQWQDGKHFIVEGDEYVKSLKLNIAKFLDLKSKLTIITSLEWEHVDVYKNLKSIENTFLKLINQTFKNKGKVIACSDWPSINKIIKNKKNIITYGLNSNANWQAYDIKYVKNLTEFKIKKNKKYYGRFKTRLAGDHNVLNALACIIVCDINKISKARIAKVLVDFKGVERRMTIANKKGIQFIDDYAHHPTEVRATLQAIRQKFPKKYVRCVFQPHMVSRTKAFKKEFATCFVDCNEVILADIFASAREKAKGITSKDIAKLASNHHLNIKYKGSLKNISEYLTKEACAGEVVAVMGAGDVYKIISNF
ncbi:UDP-N-acetylmuramate--L-alanine ligase [Patescibacteria group bacterium]|nr:UDP-N-acetylmuramate--L-alanine ligase [Patescibacteria group bacterium]